MSAPIPIDRQIEKFGRLEAERAAHYHRSLAKGQMSQAVWVEKMAELLAIRKSLEFLREHQDLIRFAVSQHLIGRRQMEELRQIEREEADIAALADAARRMGATVTIRDKDAA